MNRECILTGEMFRPDNPNDIVGPLARKALIGMISSNPKLKKEVLSEILKDDEIKVEIAKSMMDLKLTDIGMQGPGTFSDFFRLCHKPKLTSKTRKASKKVRRNNKDSGKQGDI